MTTHKNAALECSFDSETGVATLLLAMSGKTNKVDRIFAEGLHEALGWAKAQVGLKGIIVGTAHKNFCVGADIDGLYPMRDPQATYDYVKGLNALFRSLETAGVPVVSHIPVSTSTFFSPPVTSQHSDGVMTLTPSIRQLVRRFWKLPIQPVLIA